MYLPKSACFSGVHAQTYCLRGKTSTDEECKWTPYCEICCQNPESVGHLLWEYPLARNVWELCPGGLLKSANNCCDFFLLFRALVEKLSIVKLERWAVISWAIWNARNKYYFVKIQTHPKEILSGALGFLLEYQTFMAAQLHN